MQTKFWIVSAAAVTVIACTPAAQARGFGGGIGAMSGLSGTVAGIGAAGAIDGTAAVSSPFGRRIDAAADAPHAATAAAAEHSAGAFGAAVASDQAADRASRRKTAHAASALGAAVAADRKSDWTRGPQRAAAGTSASSSASVDAKPSVDPQANDPQASARGGRRAGASAHRAANSSR